MKKYEWEDISMVCIVDYRKSCIDFSVYEIFGHQEGKSKSVYDIKIYERKGSKSSEDTTTIIEEAQTYIEGTIKWDACSHVTFGDEDGYIHICGGRSWRQHIELMERVFGLARDYFKDDHQKEEFNEDFNYLTKKL